VPFGDLTQGTGEWDYARGAVDVEVFVLAVLGEERDVPRENNEVCLADVRKRVCG
jgi:hypothetical protein